MLRLYRVVHPDFGLPGPALVREVEVRERRAVEIDDAAILEVFYRSARKVGPRKGFGRRLLRGRHALAHELEDGLDYRVDAGEDRVG